MQALRFYTFINFYLSSIQQGVQTAHLVHELFLKYKNASILGGEVAEEWARNHKTIIVLNGGNNLNIYSLYEFFARNDLMWPSKVKGYSLPWAYFSEDQQSLGGIITGVGIVLPESVYGAVNFETAFNSCKDQASAQAFANKVDVSDRAGSYFFIEDGEFTDFYPAETPLAQFITKLKGCSLAR